MRVVAAVCLAACGDGATLIVDPMGAEQCAAYCADTIEVDSGKEIVTAPCGDPIALPNIAIGEQVTLAVKVFGAVELEGTAQIVAADGEDLEVTVSLEATSLPRISLITPASEVAYAPIGLTIEGERFGPQRGDYGVTIGGDLIDHDTWSSTAITLFADQPGDVVVKSCGVASEPSPVVFRAVRSSTFSPFPATCSDARLVGGETGQSEGDMRAIAACGACEGFLIAEIEASSDELDLYYGPNPGCPRDVVRIDETRSAVATDAELLRCRAATDRSLTCESQFAANVVDVSNLSTIMGGVSFLVETGGPNELYFDNNNNVPIRLLEADLDQVFVIERRRAVATSSMGATLLLDWDSPGMGGLINGDPVELFACSPIALRVNFGPMDEVVVICAGDGAAEVERLASRLWIVRADAFRDAAFEKSGRILWVWAGDRLWFIDLPAELVLGSRPMPESYDGARLLRAYDSDLFVFGGPEPGQLTRMSIE